MKKPPVPYSEACLIPLGKYKLQIMSPKGVPAHYGEFYLEEDILMCKITTEHGDQQAKRVGYSGGRLSWQQLGGSHGDEWFLYEMDVYPEGILLGSARRCDIPVEDSPKSPVVGTKE